MSKSRDAFRTISEVADWLGVQAHVLRFWESKFSQVKPVKRAGGRRYYRPNDMQLLGGIKKLLHDDGLTIKGVQKMLREQGVAHVSSFSQSLDESASPAVAEGGTVIRFQDMASARPAASQIDMDLGEPSPAPETPTPTVSDIDATQSPSRDATPIDETELPDTVELVEAPVVDNEVSEAPEPRALHIEIAVAPPEHELSIEPGPLSVLSNLPNVSSENLHIVQSVVRDLRSWLERRDTERAV